MMSRSAAAGTKVPSETGPVAGRPVQGRPNQSKKGHIKRFSTSALIDGIISVPYNYGARSGKIIRAGCKAQWILSAGLPALSGDSTISSALGLGSPILGLDLVSGRSVLAKFCIISQDRAGSRSPRGRRHSSRSW